MYIKYTKRYSYVQWRNYNETILILYKFISNIKVQYYRRDCKFIVLKKFSGVESPYISPPSINTQLIFKNYNYFVHLFSLAAYTTGVDECWINRYDLREYLKS